MSREIKYRGKRIDNYEWVYGGYFQDGTKHFIVTVEHSNLRAYKVVPKTVGQYTRLNDENKKELYEGDIITVIKDLIVHEEGYNDREVPIEINYVIIFDLEELGFKATNGKEDFENNFKYLCCCEDELIKIGNIYDNPELLED